MIADIVILLIVIAFVVIGAVRGIAKTLLNLAASAASAIGARLASAAAAGWIYHRFLQEGVLLRLEGLIADNGVSYAVQNCVGALPKWLAAMVGAVAAVFGWQPDKLARSVYLTDAQTAEIAKAIEQPLGALAVTVLSLVLLVVLFAAFFVLAKLLVRLLLKLFEHGVLKGINRFFGALLGAAEGIVIVWLAINVIYAILIFTNPTIFDNDFYFGRVFHTLCLFVK